MFLPRPIRRRAVLRGAVGMPVTVSGAAIAPGVAEADTPAAEPPLDPANPRFTVAVLPDTQYLLDQNGSDPEPLRATLRHLVRSRGEDQIAFLAHLGDVTENYGQRGEFEQADELFRIVDGRLPYSVLAGNHDIDSGDDQRGPTPYSRTFGPQRFRGRPSYGGSSANGYNSYHTFHAAGRRWLVLALDWRVSATGFGWARRVLREHPKLPVILTVHDLAFADNAGVATLSEHGQRVWEELIRGNDQIFLAIGGHYWPPGRTVLTNDAGNEVHVQITNYQDRYYGGAGMLRYYAFDLARNAIDVQTFAPWLLAEPAARRSTLEAENVELSTDVDRFSLAVDFERRFAGFAPPLLPAPRPPSAVLTRGTVAYWRFDAAGLPGGWRDGAPITADARIRDLTGNGNHLRPQVLHGGPPEVLTFAEEHHREQPGHAALRFDGGQRPDRAAVLRTGPAAPLNSASFTSGYTIETFLKLPDPFVGPHAFMGVLSWEGRAGDAGKTGGYSPDDATCSLNVSGERFLQYVVYPTNRDSDPTCWSHAVPVGEWMHIAIVNDGRRTVVYVDGSPIGRNSAEPSRGITTQGLPFAIGGTQSGGRFGQGCYGWIGDTRIVARPLPAREWLTG